MGSARYPILRPPGAALAKARLRNPHIITFKLGYIGLPGGLPGGLWEPSWEPILSR